MLIFFITRGLHFLLETMHPGPVAKQPDLLFPIVQLHDLSPLPDLSQV